ncbi:MAG: hypothetical protein Q8L23_10590 [Caulobacter sp.]|nr:hypothetical protein [Caulobacter sp.]
MSRPLLIASALSALAACGPASEAMPAKPPKPEVPAPGPAVFLVTPSAVGPATVTTPFDRNTIQRMFRGSDVSAEFRHADGVESRVIVVRGPGDLKIEFGGVEKEILGAFITGSTVRGLRDEKIGDRFSSLGFARNQCVSGIGRLSGALACHRPGDQLLGFVFAPASAADPALREFYWRAGAP